MNSNYLTESYIPLYLDKIRDFKPEFLIGYVSSINQLAQFLKNNPRRDFPKLKAVCLSSENVFPWQRELMAKVFGCRIFSFYGHSEMVLLGMECEESHNLHFYPQYGYLEVMNTNGDILDRPGAMGELVGTSFHNRVMPLIRYRTQDYGTIGEPDCKCGRHHPIISDVEGRLQEFIVTADHRLISICVMGAAHFNISKYVYETQYYQDRPGHVVFRVVPRADYGEEQKAIILKTLKTKLGNDVAVEIEEVERLKKSRSGKHIMIEQNLSVPTYWETYAITYDQSVITSQPTTLIQDSMVPAQNAVEWHTQIAGNFDLRYSKSKNFIERYAVWTRMIDKYCSPDMSVLDVGCGSGIFSFYLAERTTSVTGIDASTEMLNICQEKKKQAGLNNVDFLECDIKYLRELLDEKVDLIICSSVLEYLDDLDASLKSLFSLMKNNGVLMISMPNKQSLYRMAEPIAYKIIGRPGYYKHVKHVCTLEEIESKLKACGLDILEKQFYEQTPFLSKMLRKIGLSAYADQMFIVVAKMDCKKSMLG
ncbi:MAG: methyltransferase domain-containing protein [Pirellulales bacterium]|nr:methyltransferase domain-containing protein [Pirellulales bacterium]